MVALSIGTVFPRFILAQDTPDAEPRGDYEEQAIAEIQKQCEQIFLLNHVPPFALADHGLNRLDELLPAKFGTEADFMSNYVYEGANVAKNGVQISQDYYTELTHQFGNFSGGLGFDYWQIDTTWKGIEPSTMERDFTVYAPLAWKIISISPYWKYFYYDDIGAKDSGEIGSKFSLDMPLKPTFTYKYDYRFYKGSYYEWDISHNINIASNGERLAILTPSMALGMDDHKYQRNTTLTHIDWGLELGVPLNHHIIACGVIHFTKSLTHETYTPAVDIFEDIIPWGGLKMTMQF